MNRPEMGLTRTAKRSTRKRVECALHQELLLKLDPGSQPLESAVVSYT